MTARRALIVIDVQNEYVTGNLLIGYPDARQSLANIGRAIDAAHAAGIPVVAVQNTAPQAAPVFDRGSHGWQLHEVVASRGFDHLVDKTLPSAFTGTDLGAWIAQHGIDTLTVIGYMTHNCVASTVFEALHAGLQVEVLDDATGSVPYANSAGRQTAQQIHQAFSVVFQSRFAAVTSTGDWIACIDGGSDPARDNIVASNQRALMS